MGAKRRLLEFLEFKGVKKAEFYKQTGLSNGFLDKNNNISSDNIVIIISNYNDINLNWLIMGEGDMLTSESEHSVSTLHSLHSLFETREAEAMEITPQNLQQLLRADVHVNTDTLERVAKAIDEPISYFYDEREVWLLRQLVKLVEAKNK